MDLENLRSQLYCQSCDYDDITSENVEAQGLDGIDIHCPECGGTTKRRWASVEVDPTKLFRGQ